MEIKQLEPMDKVFTFFGEFKSATVESTIKGIVKHSRKGHLHREDYVNGGHCRPWCQGEQGLSEHHFHDSPGLRSLLRYTEMQVHIVCATKNILKTPKNIRRYDFYSYLCIRKIIFARLLT